MSEAVYGLATVIALALSSTLALVAAVHVHRLERRATAPISEEIGSAKAVFAQGPQGRTHVAGGG